VVVFACDAMVTNALLDFGLVLSILNKSEPRRNMRFFLNAFYGFEAPEKKIKAQPGGEAASPPACAIGAFIGLHGQKCI
jgi:hypothetical protein